MWTVLMILAGLVIAGAILSTIPKVPSMAGRATIALVALAVLVLFIVASSFRPVGEDAVGIVVKKVGTKELPEGQILATEGEMGPQADVLGPGWHPWLWPFIYDIELVPVVEIPQDHIGVITTTDGRPLPEGHVYAPEWGDQEFQRMLDARYFLAEGGGYKGPQTSVLKPGQHRLNTRLYKVERMPVTNVAQATVGVVKSNVGESPARLTEQSAEELLVERGERGIWRAPLRPQKYYLNPKAYEVTMVSTEERTVQYIKASGEGEEREITVRSSDGFTFPVDVRVEYRIQPEDAPEVVARFRDDDSQTLKDRLHSAVRGIFRNNAEQVKALGYVNNRSQQESQSEAMLAEEMSQFGLTVTAVRIGDVGDEASLGELLETQTDREIALQQQVTFQEQQRAAEQRKALTRTQQEAEEEKRLATAQYQVQIAEEQKRQRIIEAEAQAEAIKVEASAQAEAFRVIAQQIGPGNAALIELLKVVGERGVQITPRVMVSGGEGGRADAETTALIGTMLDTMLSRQDNAGSDRRVEGAAPASAGGG